MPNPYRVRLQAGRRSGPSVVVGELDFTDPGNQPGGGATVGLYHGNSVDVSDGNHHSLTLDVLSAGAPLLDISDPANPTVAAAGLYLVIANYTVSGLGAATVDVQIVFGDSTYFYDVIGGNPGEVVGVAPMAAGDAISIPAGLSAPTPGASASLFITTVVRLG